MIFKAKNKVDEKAIRDYLAEFRDDMARTASSLELAEFNIHYMEKFCEFLEQYPGIGEYALNFAKGGISTLKYARDRGNEKMVDAVSFGKNEIGIIIALLDEKIKDPNFPTNIKALSLEDAKTKVGKPVWLVCGPKEFYSFAGIAVMEEAREKSLNENSNKECPYVTYKFIDEDKNKIRFAYSGSRLCYNEKYGEDWLAFDLSPKEEDDAPAPKEEGKDTSD